MNNSHDQHKNKRNLISLFRTRISGGSDKPSTSRKNERNAGKVADVEKQGNSNQNESDISLEEKAINKQLYLSSSSNSNIKQNDSKKDILTFVSLPDFDGHCLRQTEGFLYMTTPPDGGYGWIILLAASICNIVINGNLMTTGLILPNIEENLNMKKSATAFIASLQTTTFYCIGPISSAFINKFGFRKVGYVGASSVVIGLIIASFCTDLISLALFFGVFFGAGCGLVGMVSQLIVAYYFEKYRTIAVGLQSACNGVGTLIYAQINSSLCKKFGWSNNLLFMAVSFFMCGMCCTAFRRIDPTKICRIVDVTPEDDESTDSIEMKTIRFSTYYDETANQAKSGLNVSETPDAEKIKRCSQSSATNEKKIVMNIDPLERVDIFSPHNPDYNKVENTFRKNSKIVSGTEQEAKEFNYRINMARSMVSSEKLQKLDLKIAEEWSTFRKKLKDGLVRTFDLKLLGSLEFNIVQVAFFACTLAMFIPNLYIVSRTKIPEVYSSWLHSSIGIDNFVIRILLGIIAFYLKNKIPYVCGCSIILGGIGVLMSCVIPHDIIWLEFLYIAMFVCAPAAYNSLRSAILISVLGIEKLTNAYGLINFGSGISSFIGLNLAGTLASAFDSTEPSFVLCGLFLLLSGSLVVSIPTLIDKLRQRNDDKLKFDKDVKKVHFNKN